MAQPLGVHYNIGLMSTDGVNVAHAQQPAGNISWNAANVPIMEKVKLPPRPEHSQFLAGSVVMPQTSVEVIEVSPPRDRFLNRLKLVKTC